MYRGGIAVLAWVTSGSSDEKQLIDDSFKINSTSARKSGARLINGDRQPQGQEDQKVMDVAAKWYVQRVTMNSVNKSNPEKLAKYQDELEYELVNAALSPTAQKKGNKSFVDQMGKHLAASLKEVLVLDMQDNRSALVNAALMLPAIARLKQEDVGDLLVELIKDKDRHDIVKVYAAKAMREFFPAHLLTLADDPKDKKIELKFKTQEQPAAASRSRAT